MFDGLEHGSEMDAEIKALLEDGIHESIVAFEYVRKIKVGIFAGMSVAMLPVVSKNTTCIVVL